MNRILIPTDFSEASKNSIFHGLNWAMKKNISVTLIHVIELYKYAAGTSETEIYSDLSDNEGLKKNAKAAFVQLLNDIKHHYKSHPPIETIITSGDLLNEIQKEIENGNVIMTVVSAALKNKKGFLTSTNYTLLNSLKCPVLLIPQNAEPNIISKMIYASSIVPSDVIAIDKLSDHVASIKATISIAHICTAKLDFQQELIVRGFQSLINETITKKPVRFLMHVDKDIVRGIEKIARDENADILVMLKKKKKILKSIINKTDSERLAFNLRIPIMYYNESYLK